MVNMFYIIINNGCYDIFNMKLYLAIMSWVLELFLEKKKKTLEM